MAEKSYVHEMLVMVVKILYEGNSTFLKRLRDAMESALIKLTEDDLAMETAWMLDLRGVLSF